MIKILLASTMATLALGAAPPAGAPGGLAPARTGAAGPAAMAVCVAGLTIAVGGGHADPVRVSLSDTIGRCGCADGCSLASLSLAVAGLTVHL